MIAVDYLLVTGAAAVATVVAVPVAGRLARGVGAVSEPDARRIHTRSTPVLGGLGMFAGLVAALLVGSRLGAFADVYGQTSDPEAVLLAAAVVVLIGIVDDVAGMSATVKLAGQMAAGAVLALFGVSLLFVYWPGGAGSILVLTPDLSALVTIAAIVVMINAVNLADGLDGLAAGMVGIGALALLVYVEAGETITLGTPTAAPLLLCAVIGMCVGFLVHNFHPASIFMGDTGSMLLGLLLAAAGLATLANVLNPRRSDIAAIGAPIFVPVLVLAVPLLDTVFAVARRVRRGGSPFAPDKRHLHHRLVEMGHSQRRAVLTMYFWSAVLAFAGVGLSVTDRRTVALGLAVALTLVAADMVVRRLRLRGGGTSAADATEDAAAADSDGASSRPEADSRQTLVGAGSRAERTRAEPDHPGHDRARSHAEGPVAPRAADTRR